MAKITIIGGGNMGSVLSVKFSHKNDVTLFLNTPFERLEDYSKQMVLYNEENETQEVGNIKLITNNLKEAIMGAEWIFITFPSFLFEDLSKSLVPLLKCGQHLVGVPGSGGFELFFKEALVKGVTLTGLQRVHSVARIMESGKKVRESGVRKEIKCSSIPISFNNVATSFLSECYSLPVVHLDNYLNVTLLNSNPILHTVRLFSIFNDYEKVERYDHVPLFYEEWSYESSTLLVDTDKELFILLDFLNRKGIKVNQITTLLEHYDSSNANEMTRKIRSIKSLQGLKTPTIQDGSCLIPDFNSRYFTADFPFGLDILLSFCQLCDIDAPNMKMISNWYHRITKTSNKFSLSTFGIDSINDIKEFYSK